MQQYWATGIINIGKAYLEKKVLFKPTKANQRPFRSKKNEFISYFIGYNKVSVEDKGFALEPWKKIEYNNFDYAKFDNILISMGNYIFTDYKDNKVKAEFSFGYKLDKDENKLKIIFHHSSLPFNNN